MKIKFRVKKCAVCNESWEGHAYRVARREFNELNSSRSPSSRSPLNEAQCRRLRELFVNADGEIGDICWNHLMEFASIAKGTLSKLVNIWRWENNRNRGDPDAAAAAPPHKKPRTAPNKTADEIIEEIVSFCYSNSSVVPNDQKIRRFEGHIPSVAEAHRRFNSEHPDNNISYTNFTDKIKENCPQIKKFKHTQAACNECCEYYALLESYNKWAASVSPEERGSRIGKARDKQMEDAKQVGFI